MFFGVFCFLILRFLFPGESDLNSFRNADKNSIKWHTWMRHEDLNKPRCILSKTHDTSVLLARNFHKIFVTMSSFYSQLMISAGCRDFKMRFWVSDSESIDYHMAYYFNAKSTLALNSLKRLSRLK